MKLLISNDDGIFAQGIRTLANTLATVGHAVTVVCPDRERSATGHGLTLHKPIRAEEIQTIFHSSVRAWACSGTPSDCVKLALGALLESPPDYVLSGINHGPNLGTDILYSGTVSAAMEGLMEGIPSIAFSLGSFSSQEFQPAANFAVQLLKHLADAPLPEPTLLNVNIPAVEESAIAGVLWTRQGIRRYVDLFEKRIDPRGKTYYWLAGEVLEDVEDHLEQVPGFAALERNQERLKDIKTDVQAMRHHCITITPLQYNLTCAAKLSDLSHRKIGD
ncbi:MAG: 5'/3'-nucleotidase SurE [Leptolyngbyaceae bacterium]|nr:5'/3'-nucleotidase SurE [Leptolyngbyaceae bacterium]